MEYILNSENFVLRIKPKIFEEDLWLPNNTEMEVAVQSDGFSGNTTMDIDIKELAKFALDLTHIYETLSGEARIEEPYGIHMYLLFVGNDRGHIAVQGYLQNNCSGNEQSLAFENDIDQTCLRCFSYDLLRDYKKYMQ